MGTKEKEYKLGDVFYWDMLNFDEELPEIKDCFQWVHIGRLGPCATMELQIKQLEFDWD